MITGEVLRSLPFFRRLRSLPCLPPGERVYAIGDIHGRMDLFRQLLERLAADEAKRGPAATRIVVLGDFIDRGPSSAELLSTLEWWQTNSSRVTVLKGNHEATLLECLKGNGEAQRLWLQFGGRETLRSFGLEAGDDWGSPSHLAAIIASVIPPRLVSWLQELPLHYRLGDYFFCHAGVEPGIPLSEQDADYLLWVRNEFLSSKRDHGAVVVHGHSICGSVVEFAGNRICVDTGAYTTGVLSAVGLEDHRQWSISVASEETGRSAGNGPTARSAAEMSGEFTSA